MKRLMILALIAGTAATVTANEFPAGNFEQVGEDGKLVGWDRQPNVGWLRSWGANFEIIKEDGNQYVRFTDNSPSVADSKKGVWLEAYLPIQPTWTKLHVSCLMKAEVKEVGDQAWYGARLTMQFEDEHGNVVKPYPPQPTIRGSQPEWKLYEVELTVPAGAKRLAIKPGLWGAIGTMSIDDIVVKVVTPE